MKWKGRAVEHGYRGDRKSKAERHEPYVAWAHPSWRILPRRNQRRSAMPPPPTCTRLSSFDLSGFASFPGGGAAGVVSGP